MKINTKTRYGVRLLLDLARHYNKGFLQLNEIAKEEKISIKYLEQIAILLRAAKLIVSQRGAQGGYQLARDPSTITVAEIFEKLEGSLSIIECLVDGDCNRGGHCVTQNVWKKVNDAVRTTLESVTLQDMADEQSRIRQEPQFVI